MCYKSYEFYEFSDFRNDNDNLQKNKKIAQHPKIPKNAVINIIYNDEALLRIFTSFRKLLIILG